MVAEALLELGPAELARRLDHRALAVDPSGLDRVQPWAPARQPGRRQPLPTALARRLWLWSRIQARTSRLTCHEALSQTSASTRTPSAAGCSAAQARKAQATGLTGRPSTPRSGSAGRRAGSAQRHPPPLGQPEPVAGERLGL